MWNAHVLGADRSDYAVESGDRIFSDDSLVWTVRCSDSDRLKVIGFEYTFTKY